MLPEVWSFIEIEDGSLHDTARKMAAESRRTANIFDLDACGAIYGTYSSETLAELKWYGLKKLYLFQGEPLLSPEIIAHSFYLAAAQFNPQFILFADTPLGAEVAARVAAPLQRGLISNCIDFESEGGKPLARKVVYNGKAHAVCAWKTLPPYLATIDLSALEDVKDKSETEPEIIYEEVEGKASRTSLLKKWEVGLSELDLSEARIVIGVGRGVNAQFMESINRLAEPIKGIIGGSRIAVYAGLIPLERQIGTTGKWLNSDVYIAIGISGAPQHAMGIKEVKNIIAINIAKEAPIFRYAKLGIIGDLYEVVPKLIDLIEANLKGES
jgi:electron transfer flavoprotein alpha subunit